MRPVSNLVNSFGKRAVVASAVCAVLISFALIDGFCETQGWGVLPGFGAIGVMLVCATMLFFALVYLFNYISTRKGQKRSRNVFLERLGNKRATILSGAVVMLCWVPILLAVWPGCFNYDSGTEELMQWNQIESGVLNAHHSVLHTLYMAFFLTNPLLGGSSFNMGVLASVVVQAVVVAVVFAWCIHELLEDGMGLCGYVIVSLYFALNPIIALFAFSTTKDVFFSALLLCGCLQIWSLYQHCEVAGEQPKVGRFVRIGITCFLVMSLRMNAVVAFVLAFPFVMFLLKRTRLKFAVASVCTLVTVAIWLVPVASLLGVQSSPIGKWNAMCVPMQQVAACAMSNKVTAEDKTRIKEMLPNLEYRENLSDYARGAFMAAHSTGGEIVRLYVSLGMKYPNLYTEAFLKQTLDAWSPFAVIDCYTQGKDGASDVFFIAQMQPATRESKFPLLLEGLTALSIEQGIESIPIFGCTVSIAFYLGVLLIALTKTIALRDRESAIALIPLALCALSNLFGPCMLIRYFLYLFFAFPFMLWLLVKKPLQR